MQAALAGAGKVFRCDLDVGCEDTANGEIIVKQKGALSAFLFYYPLPSPQSVSSQTTLTDCTNRLHSQTALSPVIQKTSI
jgi:hypothetical protein